jgi:iron(III) transport system ATP-binding protein
VELRALTKRYSQPAHLAVEDLTLDVASGEILCLLGPSGCGKTTLLRLIAGFETPDEGAVRIAGAEVAGPSTWVPPDRRRIGFVFQDYALFPHLTVLQNVAFGLRGADRADRERRAAEVLDLVGLTIFSGRYPHQLSGGQQQRVALARALAPQPAVILLDEPFSNLDAALRGATRDEVRQILKRTGTTTVLVTHDQEEALTFADRLAVMRAGRLEQEGAPETVYARPRTAFVATFLGRTNLLRGEGLGHVARTALGDLSLSRAGAGPGDGVGATRGVVVPARRARRARAGAPARVQGARPHLHLPGATGRWAAAGGPDGARVRRAGGRHRAPGGRRGGRAPGGEHRLATILKPGREHRAAATTPKGTRALGAPTPMPRSCLCPTTVTRRRQGVPRAGRAIPRSRRPAHG